MRYTCCPSIQVDEKPAAAFSTCWCNLSQNSYSIHTSCAALHPKKQCHSCSPFASQHTHFESHFTPFGINRVNKGPPHKYFHLIWNIELPQFCPITFLP
ncbi:hypothetical protein QL285_012449 [Trifolium repens]|nr:hypothetical protein QL285_012449 [Trifolium repens]